MLEVRPHAVKLEVPTDGSVPIINSWQLIRRCEPCPADSEEPHVDDPRLTESGIPVPGSLVHNEVVSPDPSPDDRIYEIDRVLSAEKVGGRYKLWIKWRITQMPLKNGKLTLLSLIHI